EIDKDANEYRSAIWVAPLDGSSEPSRFTSGERRDTTPRWSPDGKWLAFASNRGGDDKAPANLYVIPAGGGEGLKLTELKEPIEAIAWSPDGKQLVFDGLRDEDWDTRLINRLYVMDVDGGEPKALTDDEGSYEGPSFSPDGSRIAYRMTVEDGTYPHHTHLGVMNADGSDATLLTTALD